MPPAVNRDVPIIVEPSSGAQPLPVPEHPYQKAKDATYVPPATRNVGAPVRPPAIARKNGPAYKTIPPVHDPSIAADVYKRSMEAPITITQRELLSLSPEVCSQVQDITTMCHIPNNPVITSQNALQFDEELSDEVLDNPSAEALHLICPCCVHNHIPP